MHYEQQESLNGNIHCASMSHMLLCLTYMQSIKFKPRYSSRHKHHTSIESYAYRANEELHLKRNHGQGTAPTMHTLSLMCV
jgi:hypothetical protein